MTKTATNPTTSIIPEESLGAFNIPNHTETVYKQIFYSIREQLGFRAKNNLGEEFTWEEFKSKFAEVFGTPEQPLYSLEQLLAFAEQKFGMNQEALIQANKRSWERRNQREQRNRFYANNRDEYFLEDIPY